MSRLGRFHLRLTLSVLCLLALGIPGWCSTSDLDRRLKQEEKRLNQVQGQISYHRKKVQEMEGKERNVISEIESLAQQMAVTEQRISVINLRREKVKERMRQLTEEIKHTSSRIDYVKDLLRARLVAIYKYGGVAEFNLLLSAPGAMDALSTSYLLGKIADQDRRLITELSDRKARLDMAHRELKEQRALLERQNQELQENKLKLRVATDRRNDLLKRVRSEKSLHLAELREYERMEQEINSTITRLMAEKRRRLAEARAKAAKAQGTAPQEVVYYKGGRLAWPLVGQIRSSFGVRVHPVFRTRIMHTGLDISGSTGDPVRAAESGEVLYAGWLRGYGQVIILDHGRDLTTVYAHLSKIEVNEGEKVSRGEQIGRVGSTGIATGPHLHFEVRVNGKAVNPMGYLK
ncbi:Peptidase M23 [Thermanaerovibrio acidaminovorans DSM 6589]|uniref:Peptidase M23 n=1 Tax=Thermanaerovibrio acidaminovorans (strain ATCC 49978 / DSM 6589 / Su883) TaxID=525903 RepID=D1B8X2_THEAS|nr:peptidoglycan DD-metalloendopeptidase family protein [Thermanaerovibrio acidaminovorans]ACZ18725.1 Peptidase M23 [Thermanaerovibrio acidaminovorans DSM 6589]